MSAGRKLKIWERRIARKSVSAGISRSSERDNDYYDRIAEGISP